jgi:hypothetical protein
MTEFEQAVADLVAQYRNRLNKSYVSKVLVGAAEIAEKDEGWVYDEVNVEPVPATLTAIAPNTAVIGGADLTLTATGTGFTAASVIVFGGAALTTTFVSATELSATVQPATASEGIVPVLVRTGAQDTAALNFTFTAVG